MNSEEEQKHEVLGKQIVCDLLEIARLTQRPIKEMRLNTNFFNRFIGKIELILLQKDCYRFPPDLL